MKKYIASLSLLIIFVSSLSFAYMSSSVKLKSSLPSSIEYIIEEKKQENENKDFYILSLAVPTFKSNQKLITSEFKNSLYTFKFLNPLFRPPIFL